MSSNGTTNGKGQSEKDNSRKMEHNRDPIRSIQKRFIMTGIALPIILFVGPYILLRFCDCNTDTTDHNCSFISREHPICKLTKELRQHTYFPSSTKTQTQSSSDQQPSEPTRDRKHFLARIFRRRRSKPKQLSLADDSPYSSAFSPTHSILNNGQKQLAKRLAERLRQAMPDWDSRVSKLQWGGPAGYPWWEKPHGEHVLVAYLKIMKWPKNLITSFPFKLCKKDGCTSQTALLHTLEWREKYKPWMMTNSAIRENKKGFIYVRGHSPNGGHSLVWFRPPTNPNPTSTVQWIRVVINALDTSIAQNLQRSRGKIGKFNLVLDCKGTTVQMILTFSKVKQMILMQQDHFTDRLGVLLLVNLSKPASVLLGIIKKLISKEVSSKIFAVPFDPVERMAMLESIAPREFIPDWLGGDDTYVFNAKEYYNRNLMFSEEESVAYLDSMPYHAE